MRSMPIPRRSHYTENLLSPKKVLRLEKGTPLSVRGSFAAFPLEKARVRHRATRRLLVAGMDPSLRRRELRAHGAAALSPFDAVP